MLTPLVVPLLALVGLLCPAPALAQQELYVRSHSLQAPFIDGNLENRYWEFGGSTVVSTNSYVRLTPDRQSKRGWLWSKLPFSYQNWIVDFEFKVEGQGSKLFGDGFAFWVTKERAETGPVFGNRDMFNGLAIFFDTYPNMRHKFNFPIVTAMLGNGHVRYSNDDDNERNRLAKCEAQFRKVGYPTKARVKLLLGRLTVSLDVKGKNNWEECFAVEDVRLEGPNYLGFSAATGDVADNHDIIRVTSYMITIPPKEQREYEERVKNSAPAPQETVVDSGRKPTVAPPRTSSSKRSSDSGISALTVVLIILVLGFVGGAGFIFYRMQSTRRNKRF